MRMEFTQTVGLEMAFGKRLARDWDLHPYPSPIKAAKRSGKDPPLTTDTEVNSCFRTCLNSKKI